jgi:sugar lactone lactonase YvrE
VAVDRAGFVYVADAGNHRIQKFSADGTFVTKWGTQGQGNGQFESPSGVAVDAAGSVYVTDSGNHRVQKFTSSGSFLTKWGTPGSGDGQFSSPYGIAAGPGSGIYVTDSGNQRIQVFTADGTFLSTWGSPGTGSEQFERPAGIAVDGSGSVYVADQGNNRVQVFTTDGGAIASWGTQGSGRGQLTAPYDVALDPAGNVRIADLNRIQTFGPAGAFLALVDRVGAQSFRPVGVATGAQGDLYVVDGPGGRILRGRPPPILGETVNVRTLRGRVYVSVAGDPGGRARVPGLPDRRFVPLREPRHVPVGSFLDTRRGTVLIRSARDTRPRTQWGRFSLGVFNVLQSNRPAAGGVTEMRLSGGRFAACSAEGAAGVRASARSKYAVRRGRGRTRGRFGMRGRESSTSTRGTVWETIDRCSGTINAVTRGRVLVRDLSEDRTLVLRAGDVYEACAPGFQAAPAQVQPRTIRRIRARARGRFVTRSCHSAGTVRGG